MNIATQLPADVFETIQKNAGVLLNTFDPQKWEVDREAIKGATTGGLSFTDVPTYVDFGEDIDNCPKNMMELKQLDDREITVSGTYVAVRPEEIADLVGTADYAGGKITPRNTLKTEDFKELWFVCDYGADSAIALKLSNALNTAGLSIQTSDKAKGQFAFVYTAHYSMNDPDTVPYEIYIKEATAATTATTEEE